MKLFAIRMSLVAMVYAEDRSAAILAAKYNHRDIEGDTSEGSRTFEVVCENVRADQLDLFGWDEMCIPYGYDGNTRIKELAL